MQLNPNNFIQSMLNKPFNSRIYNWVICQKNNKRTKETTSS